MVNEADRGESAMRNEHGLSSVQCQCLRLVGEGRNSKEIAPLVGLSHGTVDQYLRRATLTLGVKNRAAAALLLAKMETADPIQKFEFKSATVAEPPKMDDLEVVAEPRGGSLSGLGLPPTGGPSNDLTPSAKLIAISKIALFVIIVSMAMVIIIKGSFVVLS